MFIRAQTENLWVTRRRGRHSVFPHAGPPPRHRVDQEGDKTKISSFRHSSIVGKDRKQCRLESRPTVRTPSSCRTQLQ